MTQNETVQQELVLRLQNTSKQVKLVRLEPWGDEQSLEPNQMLEISGSGPSVARLRLEIANDSVTLWGWEGSILGIALVDE